MKANKKRDILICPSILLLSLGLLTGCGDMSYKNNEEYYDTFGGKANLIYTGELGIEYDTDECSIKDSLYNAKTVNEIRSDHLLEYRYYEYLAVKVDVENFSFDTLALFIRGASDIEGSFEVRIAVVEFLPVNVRSYGLPKATIDPDTGEEIPIIYDDSDISWIAATSTLIKSSAWTDFCIEDWAVNEQNVSFVSLTKDSYILIQFMNNTGYGNDLGLNPIKLSMTNLMISKYDPNADEGGDDLSENDDDCDDEDYDDADEYDD